MAAKKSFVLRIDEATFKALEKWAGDEFRSVNGQIEWLLNQQLKEAGRAKAENARPGKQRQKKGKFKSKRLAVFTVSSLKTCIATL